MFALMKFQMTLKMGCVQSKARSPGQILGIPCVCSRGHIFRPLLLKLGQNVYLDEMLDKFENGSC